MIYILIAILMFGVLIALHELGHFITAKLSGVRVNEFAIGMGPKIISHQGKETLYALRLFPIGGYCAMEGEDEDSEDPRSFQRAAPWKKLIILLAGSVVNLVSGLVIFFFLTAQTPASLFPVVDGFMAGYTPPSQSQGLAVGDRILSVDGNAIFLAENVEFFFRRTGDTVDFVVERQGEKIKLEKVYMPYQEFTIDGQQVMKRGINLQARTLTWGDRIELSWLKAVDTVRVVWISLGDLVTGAVGIRDMAGPVGIVDMIGQVGNDAPSFAAALSRIFYFAAFLAINLGVMNLLPIPALDGGRIFFLAVNVIYTFFTRRKLNPKYEGYVNVAGFIALIGLMVVVAASDILKLFGR